MSIRGSILEKLTFLKTHFGQLSLDRIKSGNSFCVFIWWIRLKEISLGLVSSKLAQAKLQKRGFSEGWIFKIGPSHKIDFGSLYIDGIKACQVFWALTWCRRLIETISSMVSSILTLAKLPKWGFSEGLIFQNGPSHKIDFYSLYLDGIEASTVFWALTWCCWLKETISSLVSSKLTHAKLSKWGFSEGSIFKNCPSHQIDFYSLYLDGIMASKVFWALTWCGRL